MVSILFFYCVTVKTTNTTCDDVALKGAKSSSESTYAEATLGGGEGRMLHRVPRGRDPSGLRQGSRSGRC